MAAKRRAPKAKKKEAVAKRPGGSSRTRKRPAAPPVTAPSARALAKARAKGEPSAAELQLDDPVAQAVALSRSLETIESAYDAWEELREALSRSRQRFGDERRRLDEEGELLVGAVRALTDRKIPPPPPSAPVPDTLVAANDAAAADQFLAEARARLDEAKGRVIREAAVAEAAFERAFADVRATARARIEARARVAAPKIRLLPRSVDPEHRILHLERPSPEDAIVLFFVLTGRIPSRYGAPFDDSTDDVFVGPTMLYPDEGIAADELRPSAQRLHLLLDAQPAVWPLKGYLLQSLPPVDGHARFVRWLARGAVFEAELEDGYGFRNVLSREEAELITGGLLRLKLAGRLELELGRG